MWHGSKHIFSQDGHTILAQRGKTRAIAIALILYLFILRNICHENGIAPQKF